VPKKRSAARGVSKEEELTPIAKGVIEELKEAIEHVRGEITLPTQR
jgi:hypothetical protein